MRISVAAIALLTLAACGQPSSTTTAASSAAPTNTASYRAEATVHDDDGGAQQLVMYVDGGKTRFEVGDQVMVVNNETGEGFATVEMGGRQVPMALPQGAVQAIPGSNWLNLAGMQMTRTGVCSALGEQGSEWSKTEDGDTDTGCISNDGILLKATSNGRVTWETTSIARGPQPAALFATPEGAMSVEDMMRDAMAKAKARNN